MLHWSLLNLQKSHINYYYFLLGASLDFKFLIVNEYSTHCDLFAMLKEENQLISDTRSNKLAVSVSRQF